MYWLVLHNILAFLVTYSNREGWAQTVQTFNVYNSRKGSFGYCPKFERFFNHFTMNNQLERFRSINPYRLEPFKLMIPCERVEKRSNFGHCPKLPFSLCYTLNVWTVCTCPSQFEHVTRKAKCYAIPIFTWFLVIICSIFSHQKCSK